jgi:hypothetical protein
MQKDIYRIKPRNFLLWWMACGVFVYPLTVMVGGLILMPIAFLAPILMPDFYMDQNGIIFTLIGVPVIGIVIGATMAWLQRWLLRGKLYWAAEGWRKWSILGGVLGAFAVLGVSTMIRIVAPYYVADGWVMFAAMPVFVLVVSIFQWLSLRHAVRQAWLWILGNGIAGIVFSGVLTRNQSYFNGNVPFLALGIIALAVLGQGFITGYVMLFLFEKKLLPLVPEGREAEFDRPKSVWDEAI